MTFPANPILEAAPYGPQPVLPLVGPQGGPYSVLGPAAGTLLPLAARTASTSTPAQKNYQHRGIYLYWNVTGNPGGAQTLALALFGIDAVAGNPYALLTVPASATPGGVYCVYPGLSGAAVEGMTLTRNLVLPLDWYVSVTHSGAGIWSYYLSYGLLL